MSKHITLKVKIEWRKISYSSGLTPESVLDEKVMKIFVVYATIAD